MWKMFPSDDVIMHGYASMKYIQKVQNSSKEDNKIIGNFFIVHWQKYLVMQIVKHVNSKFIYSVYRSQGLQDPEIHWSP